MTADPVNEPPCTFCENPIPGARLGFDTLADIIWCPRCGTKHEVVLEMPDDDTLAFVLKPA